MDQIFIAPDPTRAFFDRVVRQVAKQFGISSDEAKQKFKFSPQTVIVGAALSTSQSQYTFYFRNNVGQSYDTDNRLDQNDFFAIQALGLQIGRGDYASSVFSNIGNYPKFTYPDPSFFTGNPASGKDEWQCLQLLVNAEYQLNVSNDAVFPGDSAQKLFYAPQTQWQPAIASVVDARVNQFNGAGPASRGLFELPVNPILDLNQDNSIVLTLPPGDKGAIDGSVDSAGSATSYRNILWLIAEGVVITNMATQGARGSMSC